MLFVTKFICHKIVTSKPWWNAVGAALKQTLPSPWGKNFWSRGQSVESKALHIYSSLGINRWWLYCRLNFVVGY